MGQYPDLSVNDARVKAQEILVDLSNGRNPTEEKRKAKLKGMTLGELLERYLADKTDLREATIRVALNQHGDNILRSGGINTISSDSALN